MGVIYQWAQETLRDPKYAAVNPLGMRTLDFTAKQNGIDRCFSMFLFLRRYDRARAAFAALERDRRHDERSAATDPLDGAVQICVRTDTFFFGHAKMFREFVFPL